MTVLVVEGPADAALLQPLIGAADLANVDLVVAGGKSSALTLGNSIALSRDEAVAVLADADTTDDLAAEEQKIIFSDIQHRYRNDLRCRLFLALPTLEDDLFPDADRFSAVYKLNLSHDEVSAFARNRKAFIRSRVLPSGKTAPSMAWHGEIDARAARDGWGSPLLRNLLAFLRNPDAPAPDTGSARAPIHAG